MKFKYFLQHFIVLLHDQLTSWNNQIVPKLSKFGKYFFFCFLILLNELHAYVWYNYCFFFFWILLIKLKFMSDAVQSSEFQFFLNASFIFTPKQEKKPIFTIFFVHAISRYPWKSRSPNNPDIFELKKCLNQQEMYANNFFCLLYFIGTILLLVHSFPQRNWFNHSRTDHAVEQSYDIYFQYLFFNKNKSIFNQLADLKQILQ